MVLCIVCVCCLDTLWYSDLSNKAEKPGLSHHSLFLLPLLFHYLCLLLNPIFICLRYQAVLLLWASTLGHLLLIN